MKGIGIMALAIPLIAVAVVGGLYATNLPITEVMGEQIGFADMVNFLFAQAPPNLPEKEMKSEPQLAALATEFTANSASLASLSAIGNPLKFCVFKDANYCQTFSFVNGKIAESGEAPKRTVYISYELALELKTRAETQNYEGLEKRMVQALKSGDIKGLTMEDLMSFSK